METISKIQSLRFQETLEVIEAEADYADEDTFDTFENCTISPAIMLRNQCARLIRSARQQQRSLSQFEFSAFPKG